MKKRSSLWAIIVVVLALSLSFGVVTTNAQANTLSYGSGLPGQISAAAPLSFFSFVGTANDIVTVQVIGTTPGFSPTVSMNAPTQQQIASSSSDPFTPGNNSARLDARLPQNGSYTLLIGSLTGSNGDFMIYLNGQAALAALPLTAAPVILAVNPQTPAQTLQFAADPNAPTPVTIQGDVGFSVSVYFQDSRLLAIFDGSVTQQVDFSVMSGSETYQIVIYQQTTTPGSITVQLSSAGSTSTTAPTDSSSTTGTTETTPSLDLTVCNVMGNQGGINVRSGPGTNYSVIGQLQPTIVTGYASDWYTINYNNRTGWVYSGVVTTEGACSALSYVNPPPAPVVPPTATTSSSAPATATPHQSGGDQPTSAPPPTTASVQTAPPDGNYTFDVDRNNGGTFHEVISYHEGDTSDLITVDVNLGQLSPDNARNVSITLSCSGTGTENVSFTRQSPNAQRYTCGQTITYRYAHPYSTQPYYVFIDSGGPSYVNYTLTATTSQ
jgi:uncharacterized protein YraI